jgi:hypothetical protein
MNFGIKILLVANRDPITDPLGEDLDRQNHVIYLAYDELANF